MKLFLASRMVLIRVIYSGHPIVVAFLLSFYHEFFFFVISMFFGFFLNILDIFVYSHVQQNKCKLAYVYIYKYLSIYSRIYNVNIKYLIRKTTN